MYDPTNKFNYKLLFQYGETFVNKVYSIEGITEEAVYKTGIIEINCQYNGTLTPPFFNETYNWCRRKFLDYKHLLKFLGNSFG